MEGDPQRLRAVLGLHPLVVSGLTGGATYRLRAFAASSGGRTSAGMGVENCGDGVDRWRDLSGVGWSWTGGDTAEVYFWSQAPADRWPAFDTVRFSRVS